MILRRLTAVLVAIAVLFSLPSICKAHTSSVAGIFDGYTKNNHYYVGSETIGWSIDESNHTNGNQIYYRCHSSLNSYFQGLVEVGAGLWGNTISIDDDPDASGIIKGNAYLGSGTPARFINYHSNSSGHLTSWTIEVNTSTNVNVSAADIAHEFGHVIGLNDLYDNSSLLMFGGTGGSALAPKPSDVNGATVITGIHSSHTWSFIHKPPNKHRHKCSVCGGFKTQFCTYDNNGFCIKCGAPQSYPKRPDLFLLLVEDKRRLN